MFTAEYSLLLHPIDADCSLAHQDLIQHLYNMELLGQSRSETRFDVGERFLSYFCFMGCSPNIELEPQENDQPYCYINIPQPSLQVQSIISKNVKLPRCPHCKVEQSQLAEQLAKHYQSEVICPECSHAFSANKVNWRKTAVFAKTWIEVGNIYEAEAIPDAQFLAQLEEATQIQWKYAYIRF